MAGLWFNILNGKESLVKPGDDGYKSEHQEELQSLQEEDSEI